AGAQSGNHLACLVHDAPGDGRLATCTGRVSPRHPEWRFVLRGRAPNIIGSIEVYETGRETPRQTLSGFDVRPRLVPGDGIAPGRVDFVLQDVNFDRFNDLRLAVGPPDGDGTAYHWFLFDKDADAFVPTDVLDGLRDPLFNPRRRLISSSFKDERGRTGRVTYKWRDGKLDASGAFAHERTEDGRCIATHYVMRDGRFEKKTETECRAGEELERE
ncbi:MAG: XAC2610-related protein, partial [Alphaproteobacteria bacterium]